MEFICSFLKKNIKERAGEFQKEVEIVKVIIIKFIADKQ